MQRPFFPDFARVVTSLRCDGNRAVCRWAAQKLTVTKYKSRGTVTHRTRGPEPGTPRTRRRRHSVATGHPTRFHRDSGLTTRLTCLRSEA